MKINLAGNWKYKLDSEKSRIEKKCYENTQWDGEITLPGTISEQKKSEQTEERSFGFLTDPYKYEGWAWFQQEIENVEKGKYRLLFERTRYTTLWINGNKIGERNTLNGKQIYDFDVDTEFIKITVLVSNVNYIVPGGHMTSPDTQTNWLGITGEISLEKLNDVRLENTKIKTYVENDDVKLNISTNLISDKNESCILKIENLYEKEVELKSGNNILDFNMPQNTLLWSDTNPNLYNLELILNNETTYSYRIGFRTFKAQGKYLYCNENKVFLRGKHDGMIFPLTGYAPCDEESWLKVMKTAKDYGINHYRFHTCCPPEAAFAAADKLGIYMAPELPFWGTIQAPGEEGFNQEQQDYLISEGYKILDTFGNHPSFVMMSMGNELWGSEKRLDDIMKNYHDFDPTRLYTGGSNNFQFWPRTTEHEDYFSGVRFAQNALIRGSYAQCDAPLGFVQTDEPNTDHNYDIFFQPDEEVNDSKGGEKEIEIQFGTGVKKVKAEGSVSHFIPNKPCISHEVGQYCMYPNYEENTHFTGVLKPYNLEEFKKRLETAGMESKAMDFFRDSSRLAVQCYKTEIEAALRSNELSGFQLLDIQDFTGQGTALVGVLNALMESKGVVTGEQWRSFCGETVVMASFPKYIWQQNEEIQADLILHNYSNTDYAGNYITAYIIDSQTDEILCEEQFDINESKRGNLNLGTFKYKFEEIDSYKKIMLLLVLDEGSVNSVINSYTLHVFPQKDEKIQDVLFNLKDNESVEINNWILTKKLQTALDEKSNGKKVIYFPVDFENKETVPGTYCTDFWCYPMFRSISESMNKQVPVGTLGLTINTKSELLKNFAYDTYTTPKWYNLISHSTCVNLGKSEINPDIQMIDNFERNWKLGILWQEDEIVYCTSRLWEVADKPEINYFVKQIVK